jgi:uncharacterized protein (TIGR00156 family)
VFLGGIFLNEGRPSSSVAASPEIRNGNDRRRGQLFNVTVAEAKSLPDDAKVLLTGNIAESLGDEKYIFRDATGELKVEIERKLLRNIFVSENDMVEIEGEVDIERREIIIDAENIRIIK